MSAASSSLQRLKSTANLDGFLQDEGGSQCAETVAELAPEEGTQPPEDLEKRAKLRNRYQELMKCKILGRAKKQIAYMEARAKSLESSRRRLKK